MPIFLCAWSEVLCYFNELFRLVAGCIWAVTTSSMNNCYCLLRARCMEFMQIQSKGKMCVCVWGCLGIIVFQMSFFHVNHTHTSTHTKRTEQMMVMMIKILSIWRYCVGLVFVCMCVWWWHFFEHFCSLSLMWQVHPSLLGRPSLPI